MLILESSLRLIIRKILSEATVNKIINNKLSNRNSKEWENIENIYKLNGIPVNKQSVYNRWLLKYVDESGEPLRDVVGLLLTFNVLSNKPSKWKNNSKNIFDYDRNSLESTINEMQSQDLDFVESQQSIDIKPITSIDKWDIYLPLNIAESTKIANLGAAPAWCTARPENNAFYSYISDDKFLFYILEKNNTENKYSIGVKDGEIIEGYSGGETVDKDNNAFDKEYQASVFGEDIKNEIHNFLKRYSKSFNDSHPSKDIIEKSLSSINLWLQMIKSWSKKNRRDFVESIVENIDLVGKMNIEVYRHIDNNPHFYDGWSPDDLNKNWHSFHGVSLEDIVHLNQADGLKYYEDLINSKKQLENLGNHNYADAKETLNVLHYTITSKDVKVNPVNFILFLKLLNKFEIETRSYGVKNENLKELLGTLSSNADILLSFANNLPSGETKYLLEYLNDSNSSLSLDAIKTIAINREIFEYDPVYDFISKLRIIVENSKEFKESLLTDNVELSKVLTNDTNANELLINLIEQFSVDCIWSGNLELQPFFTNLLKDNKNLGIFSDEFYGDIAFFILINSKKYYDDNVEFLKNIDSYHVDRMLNSIKNRYDPKRLEIEFGRMMSVIEKYSK